MNSTIPPNTKALMNFLQHEQFEEFEAELKKLKLNAFNLYRAILAAREIQNEQSRFIDELVRYGDDQLRSQVLFYIVRQCDVENGLDKDILAFHSKVAKSILTLFPHLAMATTATKFNILHAAAIAVADEVALDLIDFVNEAFALNKKEGYTVNPLIQKDSRGRTPLSLAADNGRVGMVEKLVMFEPDDGRVTDMLLQASLKNQFGIFEKLLASRVHLLTGEVLRRIVEVGHLEIWKIASHRCKNEDLPSDILHSAVQWGRLEIVRDLVSRQPGLVRSGNQEQYSVLHYVHHTKIVVPDHIRDQIRDILVPTIIKDRRMNMDKIRKYLNELKEPHREISLDLRAFDAGINDFGRFVRTLKAINKSKNLEKTASKDLAPGLFDVKFWPVLRYVQLPDLDHVPHDAELTGTGEPRDEIRTVLDWLYKEKQVEEILELNVRDSLMQPHSEQAIEEVISKFNVRKLNWRRMDLSINSIIDAAPNVEVLHLYSSGNWAALGHWTNSEEGLGRLKELDEIHISIAAYDITDDRWGEYRKRVYDRLMAIENGKKWKLDHFTVAKLKWGSKGSKKDDKSHGIQHINHPSTSTKLKPFLEDYGSVQRELKETKSFVPIKVAILDNGVAFANGVKQNHDLAEKIKLGKSFINGGDMDSPWWLTSDLHGTQMASFISELDPFCELYIAKVCEEKRDISVESVIEAMKWAVYEQHVDIISMSLILKETREMLREIVNHAALSAVVICSTADEGNNNPEIFPAKYPATVSIAPCNHQGKPTSWSTVKGAKWLLQGENMAPSNTTSSSYISSQEAVSGSSVATAVASGLASLILACHRLANGKEASHKSGIVESCFREMTGTIESTEDPSTKYIKPWLLFPQEKKGAEVTRGWIERKFEEKEEGGRGGRGGGEGMKSGSSRIRRYGV